MSKTKTISLNVSERLSALSILNNFKGKLETLAAVLEDVKKFPVTDEEWIKADRQVTTNGDDTRWTWDNEKGGLKEIEISSETADVILKDIELRDSKGEFTLQDKPYITLRDKLR